MKTTLLKDPRTVGLFHRVSDDISQLKSDIGLLFGDTAKRAIPDGASKVTKMTREQLAAGGAFARSHLPKLRGNSPGTLGILGGALVVGALAIGYYLTKNGEKDNPVDGGGPDLMAVDHQ